MADALTLIGVGLLVLAALWLLTRLVARADGIKTKGDGMNWLGKAARFLGVNSAAGIVQFLAPWFLVLLVCFLVKPFRVTVERQGETTVVKEFVPVFVAGDGQPPVGEYIPTTGWVPVPEVIADNLNPAWTDQFDATPAGRAVLGDEDVFLWQSVRKVNNKPHPWYPNVNQESVGCCVGCGWKHCADVCQAFQILSGKRAEWKPVSVEVIYGNSRVAVGGGRISGDGSVGAWAKEAAERYGVAPMEPIGGTDLTTFSPSRAREWGRTGVPAAVNDVAKTHPVKGSALVKSWPDVKRAIQQGYPVAVCSNQGFTMERDATGKARPQGTWAHCMAIIGVRSGPNEGAFILNSWGDRAHTGPVWPADAPVAGFWADAAVIDRMVRQGDSFALSDLVGFPSRKVPLDWFIHRDVRPDPFALREWSIAA